MKYPTSFNEEQMNVLNAKAPLVVTHNLQPYGVTLSYNGSGVVMDVDADEKTASKIEKHLTDRFNGHAAKTHTHM